MLSRRTNKIHRSVVAQPASQIGTGRREQEQAGVVKSELRRRKTNNYKFNQTGAMDTEDI
ncbi:MAG: hypothetical protein KGZ96_06725 [Clostridia bacterium]|nr:hypothetical protein [Clostridia bacterium]